MTDRINSYFMVVTGRRVRYVDATTGKVRVAKRTPHDGLPVPYQTPRRSRRRISRAAAEAEIRRIMEGQE